MIMQDVQSEIWIKVDSWDESRSKLQLHTLQCVWVCYGLRGVNLRPSTQLFKDPDTTEVLARSGPLRVLHLDTV